MGGGLLSIHSGYHLATTNALPRRLCYLGIVNLGASVTLPLRSWHALGVLANARPCSSASLKLDSRTNSERFHSHAIEDEGLSSMLIALTSWS